LTRLGNPRTARSGAPAGNPTLQTTCKGFGPGSAGLFARLLWGRGSKARNDWFHRRRGWRVV